MGSRRPEAHDSIGVDRVTQWPLLSRAGQRALTIRPLLAIRPSSRPFTEWEIIAAQKKALKIWNLRQEAQREAEREAQRRAPPPDVGLGNGAAEGASKIEDNAEMHH